MSQGDVKSRTKSLLKTEFVVSRETRTGDGITNTKYYEVIAGRITIIPTDRRYTKRTRRIKAHEINRC